MTDLDLSLVRLEMSLMDEDLLKIAVDRLVEHNAEAHPDTKQIKWALHQGFLGFYCGRCRLFIGSVSKVTNSAMKRYGGQNS